MTELHTFLRPTHLPEQPTVHTQWSRQPDGEEDKVNFVFDTAATRGARLCTVTCQVHICAGEPHHAQRCDKIKYVVSNRASARSAAPCTDGVPRESIRKEGDNGCPAGVPMAGA